MSASGQYAMSTSGKRNKIGFVGWVAASILLGLLAEVLMICREVWQSNRYGFDIELDDVSRYSLAIVIGSAVHYFVLGNFVF